MALTKVSSAGININVGLPFPASAVAVTDANTLDDYEEGTWTGVLSDGTRPMAMDGSTTTGYYTKVGNLVTVTGRLATTDLNGGSGDATGNIRITGLPFTVVNNSAAYSTGGAYAEGLAITAGHSITLFLAINGTDIHLRLWSSTVGVAAMQASEWSDDGDIVIGVSYRGVF